MAKRTKTHAGINSIWIYELTRQCCPDVDACCFEVSYTKTKDQISTLSASVFLSSIKIS